MDAGSRFKEFNLAKISDEEAKQIRELEQKLGNKFFLMAFERKNRQKFSEEI